MSILTVVVHYELARGEEAMSSYRHHHTHLTSQDAEKAIEFYTQVMGAEVIDVRESAGGKMVDIDLGGVPVRVSSHTGADDAWQGLRYGLHHLGITVSDMGKFAQHLKSKGVEFVVEPKQTRPGTKIAFIKGPDDVLFEVIERKED
jgi:catechol 2,3-dioxygenase-like lactoylglutathione lyase family enzyme